MTLLATSMTKTQFSQVYELAQILTPCDTIYERSSAPLTSNFAFVNVCKLSKKVIFAFSIPNFYYYSVRYFGISTEVCYHSGNGNGIVDPCTVVHLPLLVRWVSISPGT
jgi:hypothetical protein